MRCPECGATDAGADESRSIADLTYMQCNACGNGDLVDHWQIGHDWNLEIEHVEGHELPEHVEPLPPGEDLVSSLARIRAERQP